MPEETTMTTTETPATGTTEEEFTSNQEQAPLGEAGQKALDAMKAEVKTAKAEAREAKTLRSELEQLKQRTMTDQEKAVAEAVANAREEASMEVRLAYGARLVDAEVKGAAAGRTVDVGALLDGLDRSRFLTPEGEPDTAAIVAWVDRIAPQKIGPLDLGQGVRTTGAPEPGPGKDRLLAAFADKQTTA